MAGWQKPGQDPALQILSPAADLGDSEGREGAWCLLDMLFLPQGLMVRQPIAPRLVASLTT